MSVSRYFLSHHMHFCIIVSPSYNAQRFLYSVIRVGFDHRRDVQRTDFGENEPEIAIGIYLPAFFPLVCI